MLEFINTDQSPKALWMLNYSWNKGAFPPSEQANIRLSIQNTSGKRIFIKTVRLNFDWNSGIDFSYNDLYISPNEQHPISYTVKIPSNVTGERRIYCALETFVYQTEIQEWSNYGFVNTSDALILHIQPTPIYKAFISRSNWEQDKPLINPIVQRISEWGFNCYTVGINIKAHDPNNPSPDIIREIKNSDCLIAIATPRDLLVKNGLWTAPEWLHGEIGIGFGKEKPIFIVYEETVQLAGLTSAFYRIPFSMFNLSQLMYKIDDVMPEVRKWIENKKSNDMWTNVLIAGGVGLVGYVVYKAGEEKGRTHEREDS